MNANYQKGKIYKIVCRTSGLVYIGSTTRTLGERLSAHKWNYKNGKLCKSILVLENNTYNILLIENWPCENKTELEIRERFYIESEICVNLRIPYRTVEEKKEIQKELSNKKKIYRQENKIEIAGYYKKYYEENKLEIEEGRKKKIECECGSTFRLSNKSYHKKSIFHQNFLKEKEK